MADQSKNDLPDVKIEGDVVDSSIVIGNNNVVNNIRNIIFRDTKQLAIFIVTVLLVAGGITFSIWYSLQPRRMTGNFNIAVAQFGEITENGSVQSSARAEKISSTLFNFLDSEYRASGLGLSVQVAHQNMPLIIEDAQAEELAKKINADIVIYGNVYVQGDQAEFSPRFYVAQQADVNELTGQNELAFPIRFDVSQLGSQDKVNAELRTRTEILFNFTKGLIYFSQKDDLSAFSVTQAAIKSAENLNFKGKEALYLFASKIQLNQKNYAAANQFLDRALEINSAYARAYLMRGNIFYLQALDANFDPDLLNQAMIQYEAAYQSPEQPEGAYIPVKAHTAFGNILVIIAQQKNDRGLFAKAIEHYKFVTEQFERTRDPAIQGHASIAYFGLGAAYERQDNLEQAVEAYQKAFELTTDQDFQTRIQQKIKDLGK